MQREGSPWRGLGAVTMKELSDHLGGIRMRVIEWLVVIMAIAVVYASLQQIRQVTAEDPFLFLRVFTRTGAGNFLRDSAVDRRALDRNRAWISTL